MFFTSFLTLDFHTSIADLQKHNGHEFFHFPRRKKGANLQPDALSGGYGYNSSLQDAPGDEKNGVKFSNNYNGKHDTHEVLTLHEDELMKLVESKVLESASSLLSSNHDRPSIQVSSKKEPCIVKFKPLCRVNPLVRYWDDVMECYTSPLRKYHGLSAPLEEQKFVVFQPDSGGWNNIRMALEVVILFAQVNTAQM